MKTSLKIGDYVLGTKFNDAHAQDHFAIGFYGGITDRSGVIRHRVTDEHGVDFRLNGFRRVEKVNAETGNWLVRRASWLEKNYFGKSLFRLARLKKLQFTIDSSMNFPD